MKSEFSLFLGQLNWHKQERKTICTVHLEFASGNLYKVSTFTNEYMKDVTSSQLIEHCIAIAEVMGLNPVQAWILFRL